MKHQVKESDLTVFLKHLQKLLLKLENGMEIDVREIILLKKEVTKAKRFLKERY